MGEQLVWKRTENEIRKRYERFTGVHLNARIFPPSHQVTMLRKGLAHEIESERVGNYGSYLRIGDVNSNTARVMNEHGGSLLRTKAASSDEGGVAAGYAVLDSPYLV